MRGQPTLHELILTELQSGDSFSPSELARACSASRRDVSKLLHTELRLFVVRDPLFCWRLADENEDAQAIADEVAQINASPATFIQSFLGRRGLTAPDGRPLYRYRCSEAEFEALHHAISDIIDVGPFSRAFHIFAPLFVLYAAEWWRRHQGSGVWAWEPIFESIELPIDNVSQIYPAVTRGLKAWDRAILRNTHGRMFLVTLGCEGGLPLQVMRTEGARLRKFFRELLEDYGVYLRSGTSASALARRNEALLPRSLRQEIVFELAGQLIESIWDLQERVHGAKDPVAELDRIDPDWRQQLPIELDDAVAAAFLNKLVETASRIRQGSSEDFRLTRYLTRLGGWNVHSELSFPPSVDGEKMRALTQLAETATPSRGLFVLVSSTGRKLPAVSVTKRFRGDGADYVFERLGDRMRIAGRDASDGWRIEFESQLGATPRREFRGSGPLADDAPWVFSEVDEGRWRFLGQGSLKTRIAECVVILPADLTTGEGEPLGEWEGRAIRRISASVEIVHPQAGTYRIQLGQSEEQANAFRILGNQFPLSPDDRELYHGIPSFYELLADGRQRKVPDTALQWRPIGSRDWRDWSGHCAGRVAVRIVQRDETRFTQTVDILPADFSVSLSGESATTGTIELQAQSAFHARPLLQEGLTATVNSAGRVTVALKAAREAQVPAIATLEIDLGDDRHLNLVLPFPARGVRYVGPGDRLFAFDETVSVDVLALTRADLFVTGSDGRRTIDANLYADDLKPGENVSFAVDLPPAINGRVSFEFRRLVPQVHELLSQTDDAEGFVTLQVDGVGPNRLNVRKYDIDLQVSDDQAYATFTIDGRHATEADACFEMIPLWQPGSKREPVFYDDSIGQWKTGIGDREAGPWLLVSRASAGFTTRPRLLYESGEITGRTPLATAVSLSSRCEAESAVKAALAELVEKPLDEEWSSVVSLLKLAAELPSSSFFVMTGLRKNLDAAVLALIHAGSERQLVWDTLQQAGVEWTLVPYNSWRRQIHRYGDELKQQLGDSDQAEELVAHEIEAILDFLETGAELALMKPIWSFLRWHLFGEKEESIVGVDVEAVIPVLRSSRNALLARETVGRRWPTPPRISDTISQLTGRLGKLVQQLATAGHQRPVFAAPLIAAFFVAKAQAVPRRMRGEFRRIRRFDPEWFDAAYRAALIMELNRTHAEEIASRG